MNNPLLPVLDANREVLRVASRRERHLWHLFLAATTTAGPPVTRLDRLARSTRDLFERAGGDHWQGLCRRSLISGSLSQFS